MFQTLMAYLLLAQVTQPKAPTPPTATEVVDKVQAFYKTTKRLRADFGQTYVNTTFGKKQTSSGELMIAKPGKMRWDYKAPTPKFFISDGTTLWVYEKEAKQAYKADLKDLLLPVAVTFLYGKGDLKQDFTAALDPGKYGGKGDIVLKLTPKQPSAQYKNLWLVVDAADFHVRETVILEATGNINSFRFSNIRLNDKTKIKPSNFRFTPPEGVRVLSDKEAEDAAKGKDQP